MATLVRFDAIGLADGPLSPGAAGTGDNPVDSLGGGASGTNPVTKVTDAEMGPALQIAPEEGKLSYARWNHPGNQNTGVRLYVKRLSATAAGNQQFLALRLGGTMDGRISLSGSLAPGQGRYYFGSSSTYLNSPQGTITANLWYRFEAYIKRDLNGDGTFSDAEVRFLIYDGDSTTALYDSGFSATTDLGGLSDGLWLGQTNAAPNGADTLRFAHLEITDDADTLIGPYDDGGAPEGWTGVKSDTQVLEGAVRVKSGANAPIAAAYVKSIGQAIPVS